MLDLFFSYTGLYAKIISYKWRVRVQKKSCFAGGFTLIELLVVVLIIGILAAIALPQYQKAVERARMTEAMQVLDNVVKAESILYMQTGRFADSLDVLNSSGDITVQDAGDAWNTITIGQGSVATNDGINHGTGRVISLVRSNGRYQGGRLSGWILPDGFVHRNCINPAGNTEFCSMAENAGYTCSVGGTGTSCPS